MQLHDFLIEHKSEILQLAEKKTTALAGLRAESPRLKIGLPLFLEQLVRVLEERLNDAPPVALLEYAAAHGKEYLRLGFSLSHVVHAYGAMCQAITELATMKNGNISSSDFNVLNGCLDVAIAAAVSEFQFRSNQATEEREVENLGFLAHELRNALSSATVAHEMIKAGLVGTGGSTASVLESNLSRMRHLIDRSLSEVRTRADSDPFVETFRMSDLFDQIILKANVDAQKKKQILIGQIDWQIEVDADRQLILAAIANLVQNAIKYTKSQGKIWLRGRLAGDRVLIEVEDECGGINTEKLASMFMPHVQAHEDRSGLGLGLTISQRAINLSRGTVNVRNNPGHGCTFEIDIPHRLTPQRSAKTAVPGVDSVQPNFSKRK